MRNVKVFLTKRNRRARVTPIITRVLLLASVVVFLNLIIRKRALVLDKVRAFNKRLLNPAVLNIAGREHSPYAAIHHVGRHSGEPYATPVVAEQIEDGFEIPLPYGDHVDWYRNLQAAGRCTLEWQGVTSTIEHPEVLDAATALPLFSPARRKVFQFLGIQQYLRVHVPSLILEKTAVPA
jgi:deazaflavin-dependent oxidoreductase (nitroreductase family)